MSLQKILFASENKAELFKQLKKGFAITGGVFVVLLLIYFSLDYRAASDTNLLSQIAQIPDAQAKATYEAPARALVNALVEDRQHIFMSDLLRSLFFIAAAALALYLFHKKILKAGVAVAVIGLLSFIDIIAVDTKYLNSDNYKDVEESETTFLPTTADQSILTDTSYYRVFNIVGDNIPLAFNHGALPSYFHNSIGGYHPAKLSIYQDLIEKQLYRFPKSMPVVNMLNTKYIIYGDPQKPQVQQNPDALGPAWFVKGVTFVKTPQEEMAALDNLNTRDSAVALQQFNNVLSPVATPDTAATIRLVKNDNDIVTYTASTTTPQVAVFSEVYYDKGWNAYLNDKQVPYAKVNYVLRGMNVPAGQHTIQFRFEPASYAMGRTITTICSLILILLLGAAIYFDVRDRRLSTNTPIKTP